MSGKTSTLIYHAGYKQGCFDTLFDLVTYLNGTMQQDLSTGKLTDIVQPDNAKAFKEMGLQRGQRKK